MSIPAETTFRHDPSLSPAQKAVYLYLTTVLDVFSYRPVKAEWHAKGAGVHRETYGKAVDTLVQRGYLQEGDRGTHNVRQLRLAYSVELPEQKRAG